MPANLRSSSSISSTDATSRPSCNTPRRGTGAPCFCWAHPWVTHCSRTGDFFGLQACPRENNSKHTQGTTLTSCPADVLPSRRVSPRLARPLCPILFTFCLRARTPCAQIWKIKRICAGNLTQGPFASEAGGIALIGDLVSARRANGLRTRKENVIPGGSLFDMLWVRRMSKIRPEACTCIFHTRVGYRPIMFWCFRMCVCLLINFSSGRCVMTDRCRGHHAC